MKRAVIRLGLWLCLLVLLSSVFLPANPPGGTGWPFYLLVPAIPAGAILAARYPCPRRLVIAYAVIAGAWFAFGATFTDPAWQRGGAAPDGLSPRLLKFCLILVATSFATLAAWRLRRPRIAVAMQYDLTRRRGDRGGRI